MDGRLLAASGALALLAGVALVNSHRAALDRATARPVPAPSPATATPAPTDITAASCQFLSSRASTLEAELPYAVPGHPDLRVTSTRCSDASGMRSASLVHVIDLDDDHRIIATLIRPTENLHVASLSVAGSAIAVTAFQAFSVAKNEVPSRLEGGGVVRIRFSSVDGVVFTRYAPVLVAGPCQPGAIEISAASIGTRRAGPAGLVPPSSAVLLLHNTSGRPCAVEGYPQVAGGTATGVLLTAWPELAGPDGGVRASDAPPVVILTGWASSIIEAADRTAPCTSISELIVALPDGGALGGVGIQLRACAFRVHPLVAGTTGTMP